MENSSEKFVQSNSPDGGFLQSPEWRKFQAAVGRKTHSIIGERFSASIIEHRLPLVGTYFYVPRGPIMPISNFQFPISNQFPNQNDQILKQTQDLTDLARKEKAGWIRIDPATEDMLKEISAWTSDVQMHSGHPMSIRKAPHDVQPKEIFIVDITKTEEELLAEMKSKTRYNIRLAEKKGVNLRTYESGESTNDENKKYISEFLRLVKVTAKRDGIVSHPENYYKNMLEVIPGEILKLYVAEYENKIIAANLVLFYGGTCTYMHGASDDAHRNVMAPFLLQWRQIQDAKKAGCVKYDFGGVSGASPTPPQPPSDYRGGGSSWTGITRFKTGFSPATVVTQFLGSYDIIINRNKYNLYRLVQKIKAILK